jgi:hypothetical protein
MRKQTKARPRATTKENHKNVAKKIQKKTEKISSNQIKSDKNHGDHTNQPTTKKRTMTDKNTKPKKKHPSKINLKTINSISRIKNIKIDRITDISKKQQRKTKIQDKTKKK